MAADFTIGYGDKLPALVVTPTRADNSVVDVAGQSAKFYLDGVEHDADIVLDSGVSKLSYTFPGDDAAGYHNGYFVVDFGGTGTNTERFPNNGEILIQVFDALPGQILTNTTDYQAARAILGIDSDTLGDDDIELAHIKATENHLADVLTAYGVTNDVATIMGAANDTLAKDRENLKIAATNYLAFLISISLPTLLNTSETVGPEVIDQGTAQGWKDQGQLALARADQYLGKISGFKRWRSL